MKILTDYINIFYPLVVAVGYLDEEYFIARDFKQFVAYDLI